MTMTITRGSRGQVGVAVLLGLAGLAGFVPVLTNAPPESRANHRPRNEKRCDHQPHRGVAIAAERSDKGSLGGIAKRLRGSKDDERDEHRRPHWHRPQDETQDGGRGLLCG